MRIFGWSLFVFGVSLIVFGWAADATVSTSYNAVLGGSRDVVNFHRLFVKLSLLLVGGFCLPTGAIFIVAAGFRSSGIANSSQADRVLQPLPEIDLTRSSTKVATAADNAS